MTQVNFFDAQGQGQPQPQAIGSYTPPQPGQPQVVNPSPNGAAKRVFFKPPIDGPMELCESDNTLEVTRFPADAWRVVVQIDPKSGGSEERGQSTHEAVEHSQSEHVASVLDESVVVDCEDV